jgi:DNA-binding SARP family transcriptional activator/tetratricopeptide (TPR) repeat protein
MPGSLPRERGFRVRLFGGPRLELKGRELPLSPSHGLFLAILAYHGRRGIRRDRLLSFLWPAGPEGTLRRRLSQLQYSLHRRVRTPDLVVSDGDRFFLDVDRVEPDLEQFHTALQERRLEEALELLFLGFLGEVNPIPTPELDSWIRERLRQFRADVRTAAARLWGEAEQRGDWEQATRTGRVLLALDPLDEAGLRRLLRSLGLTGQVAEARAVFREFTERASVAEEPWAPEEETMALVNRLDTLARERGPTFMVGRYGLSDTPPLVGREDELATLGRLLRDPSEASILSIGLVGEPGVGKTRLAWEALRTLPFDGVRVLSARCSEFERRIPLSPFISALKPAWVAEEARHLDDPWRAVLLSLFPEWHPGPDPAPEVPEIEPSEVPRRICEAFRQLFLALAQTDPLVLFIDDFHWADETSLSVLDYIRSRGVEGDFRVLVARSPTTSSLPSGVNHSRYFHATHDGPCLRLANLSVEHVEHLLRLSTQEVGTSLKALDLWALSSGNPHHLSAAFAAMRVARAKGCAKEPLLTHLRPLIADRLAVLSQCEFTLASLLAFAETPIRIVELAEVADTTPSSAAKALDRLASFGWIVVSTDGVHMISPLLREAIRTAVPQATAVMLHRRIANVLLTREDHLGVWTIAHHLLEGQEPERAKEAVLSAADVDTTWACFQEIEDFLQRLLRVSTGTRGKQELSARLGQLQFQRGDFNAARLSLGRAWQLGLRTSPDEPSTRDVEIKLLASDLYTGRVSPSDGWKRARAIEDIARQADQSAVFPDLYKHVLRSAQLREDADTARAVLSRAGHLLGRGNQALAIQASLNLILSASVFYDGPSAALPHVTEALRLGTALESTTLALEAHLWHLIVLYHLGCLNLPQGIEGRQQAFSAATSSGNLLQRSRMELNNAVWYLDSLELEAAEVSLSKVEVLIGNDPLPHLRASWLVNLGELRLQERRWDLATDCFDAANRIFRTVRSETGELLSTAGLGLAALGRRKLKEAEAYHEQLPTRPRWWTCDPTLVQSFLIKLASRKGTPQAAQAELEGAIAQVKGRSLPWYLRLCLLSEEVKVKEGFGTNSSRVHYCREKAAQLNLGHLARRFRGLSQGH